MSQASKNAAGPFPWVLVVTVLLALFFLVWVVS